MAAFTTDRIMLYNVSPWAELGFAAPNVGTHVGTLSNPIADLVDELGRGLLAAATHQNDGHREKPPSVNTVRIVCKMVARAYTVISSHMREYNQARLDTGHANPMQTIFTIHPVPYFPGYMRNKWLREYIQLGMVALTHAMQHSDNTVPLSITAEFGREVWQYLKEIQVRVGVDLLGLPRETVEVDGFKFTDEHFKAYNPLASIVNLESMYSPGMLFGLPSEQDLRPFFAGIPATQVLPMLAQYPTGPIPGVTGVAGVPQGQLVGGVAPANAGQQLTNAAGAGQVAAGRGIGAPQV